MWPLSQGVPHSGPRHCPQGKHGPGGYWQGQAGDRNSVEDSQGAAWGSVQGAPSHPPWSSDAGSSHPRVQPHRELIRNPLCLETERSIPRVYGFNMEGIPRGDTTQLALDLDGRGRTDGPCEARASPPLRSSSATSQVSVPGPPLGRGFRCVLEPP